MIKKKKLEKTGNFKSKFHLIEDVIQQNGSQEKLIRKIVRQVKLAKKPQAQAERLKIDWDELEHELKETINQWQKKQIKKTIDQFLEAIKLNLTKKANIALRNYFSLKVYHSPQRKSRNPHTGQPITVKAKNRISFRTSLQLKKAIN